MAMDQDVRELIANLPAADPAQTPNGPVMGHDAASTIVDAFENAGYVLIKMSELEAFLSVREMGIENIVGMNGRELG
jgi:hypothetical protein